MPIGAARAVMTSRRAALGALAVLGGAISTVSGSSLVVDNGGADMVFPANSLVCVLASLRRVSDTNPVLLTGIAAVGAGLTLTPAGAVAAQIHWTGGGASQSVTAAIWTATTGATNLTGKIEASFDAAIANKALAVIVIPGIGELPAVRTKAEASAYDAATSLACPFVNTDAPPASAISVAVLAQNGAGGSDANSPSGWSPVAAATGAPSSLRSWAGYRQGGTANSFTVINLTDVTTNKVVAGLNIIAGTP